MPLCRKYTQVNSLTWNRSTNSNIMDKQEKITGIFDITSL